MERMRISFTIEEEKVGKMLSLLTAHHVVNLNFEVIEDVPPKAPRVGGTRAQDIVLAAVAASNGKPIHTNDLGAALEAEGLSRNSTSALLTQLFQAKLLKRHGRGYYVLAQPRVPTMDAVKEVMRKQGKPRKRPVVRDISGGDLILKILGRVKKARKDTLRKHFREDGRSPSSVDSALNTLFQQHKVKRVGEATYALMRKASKPKPKKKPAPKKPAKKARPMLRPVETVERAAA